MNIEVIREDFTIYKMADYSSINMDLPFVFISKTDEENSLVCPSKLTITNYTHIDEGWKAFRISGILDFSIIGILANIANLLAINKISIFAISTYHTDYILIKKDKFELALNILKENNYHII